MKTKIAVVDISSFIFRAFFAVRPLSAPDGTPVNAVHGVLSMLLKLLSEYRPTHVVLARDLRGGSFRNELYKEYKANRGAPPDDLIPQFALIEQLMEHLKLPNIAMKNYEADDVIGSIAVQWKDQFDEIDIISGDKDLMQFVGGNIKMVDTQKGKTYGRDEVFTKMGVYPEQMLDYLSMVGDASDNIPGMKGIGAKGAAKLLGQYQTLKNCIEHRDEFTNKRVKNAFFEHVEDAQLSAKLVAIVEDLELPLNAQETEYQFAPDEKLLIFLRELGLKSFVSKIEKMREDESMAEAQDEAASVEIMRESYFDKFVFDLLDEGGWSALCVEVDKVSDIFMVADYSSTYEVSFLALHIGGEKSYIIKGEDQNFINKIFSYIWSNSKNKIISYDIQRDLLYALENNIEMKASSYSIGQAHFIAHSTGKNVVESLVPHYLQEDVFSLGRGEKIGEVEDATLKRFWGERVSAMPNIFEQVQNSLAEKELDRIYNDFDAPLFMILAKIEQAGVLINSPFFNDIKKIFDERITKIKNNIFEITGEEINLKSPKQVSTLLFEKLSLPVIKKTKTGFSTDSDVLEQLKEHSEVPAHILEFREIEKLLSTYVNVIPEIVWKDQRVHSHFNLNVAATGRLSSTNPNLQNIPVRSANGKLIRKGFVAKPGSILLSADYSQVELRLLAHFSEDEVMMDAFNSGKDIHAQTAAEVEGIALDQVSSAQRAKAKAVNFGLMYGQSAFGLAGSLGISRAEAKEYIQFYFERFGKIRGYLDSLKEFAHKNGFVETMHGRKRFISDIHSSNRTVRAMAERVAINSPVQGTAADIIKLAMINIDKKMSEYKLTSKMLLQVHDELIFEVPDSEIDQMRTLVKSEMESVVELKVPLTVDMGLGVNWFDLK